VALNGGRPDPDGMYGRYFTSTGNLNKVAGFSSPELDALFAQGKATADPAARKAIYERVSAELEDNAAWVWLFTSFTYTATSPGLTGFTPMPNNSLKFLRETTVSG
jgi:peptide/nickel transport system substrate-binding protein